MHSWLATSLVRHYPGTPPVSRETLTFEAARGEQCSFQLAFRAGDDEVKATVRADAPDGLNVQVRRVGYVPVPHLNTHTPLGELDGVGHIPGYVPDPLFPDAEIHAGPCETHAFWFTVRVATTVSPGAYPITLTLMLNDDVAASKTVTVNVHRAVIASRANFPVTHWFYADALCDWYKVEVWQEAFWPVLDPYLADVAAHGQDTIYVPVFTPPLDGVKRPTQLLGVTRDGDRYTFDWSLVRRWVQAAKTHGITRWEWTHLFTQWGVAHAIRIYEGHGETQTLLWPPETGAVSSTYRTFLAQFLPEFERFLRAEGLLESSFFHLSDEPHGEQHLANYRAARELLRELAPWMRVMDALSEIKFAHDGLTDIPVPIISNAPDFIRDGFAAWTYFCCGPRGEYLNRLLDTPLVKIRMSGWLFYRTRVHGFLHWGYNYWYKSQTQQMIDPFTITDGLMWPGWSHGDTFMVYPGPAGPIDSLRWEVFAESLQDYALLQTAGFDPDSPALAAIHDYAEFPRDERWIARRRREILAMLDAREDA